MIKVYIAGPMTGVGGNFNIPLFDHVANRLRSTGKCEVFNPADLARQMIGPLEMIMKLDKKTLKAKRKELIKHELVWICERADYVLTLPGWQRSAGAKAEVATAEAVDVPVRQVPNVVLYDSSLTDFDFEMHIENQKKIEA